MENKHDSATRPNTGAPAGGDRDCNKSPEVVRPQEETAKKKKRRKNKQKKTFKTEDASSHQSVAPQHTRDKTTSDQSTQTEAVATQTQDTQTLPLQCTHTKETESKSTQTVRTHLTLKQVYEGQAPDQIQDPNHLTVLTWNIDGLDDEDIKDRVRSLVKYLAKCRADVILMQELIADYLKVLQNAISDYEILPGSEIGYFTGIFLRKSRVELLESSIVKFPTTEMMRNLLMATVNFSGHQLCLMTSHLESLKTGSQERLNQLRRVWKRMKEVPDGQTVIFGGDTNLRDWEVQKLGGLPDGITDVWEMLGKPEDCMYTWDTVTNNNKEIPVPARLRFDRVYLRTAKEGAQLHPDSMTLVGLEKLKCGRFTSDHWGLFCTFSFQS